MFVGEKEHGVDVQEVRLEDTNSPGENEDVSPPIDWVLLYKRKTVLNSLELSVQDVHLDFCGFRKCALGWIYFMRRVLVCRRVSVSQPRHV
jgi:hypothetical protein